VPLGLATWTFGRVFRASEIEREDSALTGSLQVATDRLAAAGDEALRSAAALARTGAVQRALGRHDRDELRRLARREGRVSLSVLPARARPAGAGLDLVRTVSVVGPLGAIGSVVARVRLSPELLRGSGAAVGTTLVLTRRGIAAQGPFEGLRVAGPVGRGYDLELDGVGYRALAAHGTRNVDLVALVRRTGGGSLRRRQTLTLAAGAVTVAAIAMLGLFVLPLRRLDLRRRGAGRERDLLALVGDAFAAAHDMRALLPVILETTVGATGAAGGRLVWDGEVAARIGTPREMRGSIVLSLAEPGFASDRLLVLYPPARGFNRVDRDLAAALVAQGRIALENARLHSIVRRQAVTDELTDLANRRRFMEALRQEVARSDRFGTSLALVLFDLDDFKQINDNCGHQVGDAVLRQAAQVIRERVRETDLAGRVGGEEFAVLLAGTDLEGASVFAENLRRALTAGVSVAEAPGPVTASFGVAAHRPGQPEADLVGVADRALYRAKAEGKDRVVRAE
jgi:diguanylate cyclase (GGDEF)-like protein